MGNAFSRLISSLFGEKEIRILILGLDNGECIAKTGPFAAGYRPCNLFVTNC